MSDDLWLMIDGRWLMIDLWWLRTEDWWLIIHGWWWMIGSGAKFCQNRWFRMAPAGHLFSRMDNLGPRKGCVNVWTESGIMPLLLKTNQLCFQWRFCKTELLHVHGCFLTFLRGPHFAWGPHLRPPLWGAKSALFLAFSGFSNPVSQNRSFISKWGPRAGR